MLGKANAMASRINIPTGLQQLRRKLQSGLRLITKVSVFLFIALFGGTASSWYAVEYGMPFNTETQGPWKRWSGAGRTDSDPYTRNRFSAREQLLYNANLSYRFEATSDSKGRLLHSSCDYVIEGRKINAPWWGLAVFDGSGRLKGVVLTSLPAAISIYRRLSGSLADDSSSHTRGQLAAVAFCNNSSAHYTPLDDFGRCKQFRLTSLHKPREGSALQSD